MVEVLPMCVSIVFLSPALIPIRLGRRVKGLGFKGLGFKGLGFRV